MHSVEQARIRKADSEQLFGVQIATKVAEEASLEGRSRSFCSLYRPELWLPNIWCVCLPMMQLWALTQPASCCRGFQERAGRRAAQEAWQAGQAGRAHSGRVRAAPHRQDQDRAQRLPDQCAQGERAGLALEALQLLQQFLAQHFCSQLVEIKCRSACLSCALLGKAELWTSASALRQSCWQVVEEVAAGGAAAVTIHGRTMEQRYRKAADWRLLREVAASSPVPVTGNGDILTHY